MRGKVKFYRETDGYGFIQGDDGQEYYFNMHGLREFDGVPRTGQIAEFTVVSAKGKGRKPKAENIAITGNPAGDASSGKRSETDYRMICPHCQRKMVPRMVTRNGAPYRSYCPYCGGMVRHFTACFIATSVYGDPRAPEVIAIRRFRNEVLEPRWYGRILIRCYYRISPPVAGLIRGRSFVTRPLKGMLDILARRYG